MPPLITLTKPSFRVGPQDKAYTHYVCACKYWLSVYILKQSLFSHTKARQNSPSLSQVLVITQLRAPYNRYGTVVTSKHECHRHECFDVTTVPQAWVLWCHNCATGMSALMSQLCHRHECFDVTAVPQAWVLWCHNCAISGIRTGAAV